MKIERDETGKFLNIEQHLRNYVTTEDEQLFTDVIYPYLKYLATWELQNHDVTLYDDNNLVDDMITHTYQQLSKFKSGYKMTCQSWCRYMMKQYLMKQWKYNVSDKRNVLKAVSLNKLMEDTQYDIPIEVDQTQPYDKDLRLSKLKKAVLQIPNLTEDKERIYNTIVQFVMNNNDIDFRKNGYVKDIAVKTYPHLTSKQCSYKGIYYVYPFLDEVMNILKYGVKEQTIVKCNNCGYVKHYCNVRMVNKTIKHCPYCLKQNTRTIGTEQDLIDYQNKEKVDKTPKPQTVNKIKNYFKHCPNYNKKQGYGKLNNYNRAIRKNTNCNSCANRKNMLCQRKTKE